VADATSPWCLGGLHWNWIVFARRLGTSPWPTTPGGTPTRAIYVAALGGRCRRWPWLMGRIMYPRDICRRGLRFCFCDDPDCRRSLAIAMACAVDDPTQLRPRVADAPA
jgi:hypothetical protein